MSEIKNYVEPGTIIHTDCWRGYLGLEEHNGYKHQTVNHKVNYIDLETGAHSQNIERSWRDVRDNVQKMGVKQNDHGHMSRIMFMKRFKNSNDRVHKL